MSIKEEYQNLVDIIESAPKNAGIQSATVLNAMLNFFEKLQSYLPEAGPEEKKSFREMLDILQVKLEKVVQFIGEETGMTKEQMSQYGSNPSNFTPETWQELQAAEARLGASSRRLVQTIEERISGAGKEQKEYLAAAKKVATKRTKKSRHDSVKKVRVPKANWNKM